MTEDAPRWLSAPERQAWLALYAVSGLLPAALDADLFRRARITLFDYHVLAMVSEAEGRALPMSELAARSNASLSRLSHVVKKLEQRGWMSRTPSPTDARVTTAALTDEGMAALEALAPEHVESVRKAVFDCLTEKDVADLERVGKKILARLDPCNGILGPNEAP
ncbi:MarR family winged helix-turn-helix transcriptional regulator [Arthrobacter sp. zg-Y769]|uniref:MarR family winged helix-turn-helix transcriptional regulator n=1 Tax=Arthrobacter sp. zg-Y769 TaxID=2894191 RepID=UPI001E472CD3|nr:MarR family transcriptional regulator [Arthrobacter sp. zg-Y769]MCC9204068.1 MarR family transcriptional regulator [Arthrobacter sp. zg-Y769]